MKYILRGTILVAAMAVSSAVFAQVAYNNFGVGDTFDTSGGWTIGGTGGFTQAMQWNSLNTGIVAGVKFASFYVTGSSDLQIQLREDSAGTVGAVMKTWNITKTDGPPGTVSALFNTDPSIIVTGGTNYWLQLETGAGGHHAWNFNNISDTGLKADSADGGATWNYTGGQNLGAFAVRLTPVPEPGSMIALGLGASALLARKRRKKVQKS